MSSQDTQTGRAPTLGQAEPSLSASGSSGELNLWQQVDALRELLQHGSRLLAEVVSFTRAAEDAAARVAAEKESLSEQRHALEEERSRAQNTAEKALNQVDQQQQQIISLREEMDHLRQAAVAQLQTESSPAQLSELEQRLRNTEQELSRTRLHLCEERERRNRAISLIRPRAGVAVGGCRAESNIRPTSPLSATALPEQEESTVSPP